MMKILTYGTLLISFLFLAYPVRAQETVKRQVVAVAFLKPTQGNHVNGTLTFVEIPEGVRVSGRIKGLTPGRHGFHIHETGNCDSPDGSSAGGHYNPALAPHASPTDQERHLGDFGNILADDKGIAMVDESFGQASLSGENSLIGRSVIVHAQEDDFKTQPTGNAGARVACGVIAPVQS